MLPRRRSSAITKATAGLSLVAVLLAAGLALVAIAQPPSIIRPLTTTLISTETLTATSASTSTQTITTTSTSTATTTITSLSTQTFTQTLPPQCLGKSVSEGYFGTLDVGTSSPVIICVQLYEFDANSSIILNPASLLTIEGFSPSSGQAILDPAANFTIAASPNSVDLGGPTNANEGTIVALAITAKPGASGTYWAELRQGALEGALQGGEPALYLTSQGGEEGGPTGVLVAGTGQPDYVPSNVAVMPLYLDCTSSFSIQGVTSNICPDYLYYRITDATNSTQ